MIAAEITVIGPGRLGLALALGLHHRGRSPTTVRARDADAARRARRVLEGIDVDHWSAPRRSVLDGLVVVTVPDDRIATVATRLGPELGPSARVLHASGRLPGEELGPCRAAGAAVGSWHPLQTFPGPPDGEPWTGVACAVEGDPDAVEAAQQLSAFLGARSWEIDPGLKPRYHAAAAVASNLTHLLVAGASREMTACGLEPNALWPLVRDSVRAALTADDLSALSGAIARGDRSAVEGHLGVLPPILASVYRLVARHLETAGPAEWLD